MTGKMEVQIGCESSVWVFRAWTRCGLDGISLHKPLLPTMHCSTEWDYVSRNTLFDVLALYSSFLFLFHTVLSIQGLAMAQEAEWVIHRSQGCSIPNRLLSQCWNILGQEMNPWLLLSYWVCTSWCIPNYSTRDELGRELHQKGPPESVQSLGQIKYADQISMQGCVDNVSEIVRDNP